MSATLISSLEEGMLKSAYKAELQKRGKRFLPAQVVKRSLRNIQHSVRAEDPPEGIFVERDKH